MYNIQLHQIPQSLFFFFILHFSNTKTMPAQSKAIAKKGSWVGFSLQNKVTT